MMTHITSKSRTIRSTAMTRSPRIAYYTIADPLDKRSWSGCTYYIGQSLGKIVGDVEFLGPVRIPWLLDKIFRAIQKLSRLLTRSEYIPKYSFLKNGYAALVLNRKLKKGKYNFIFAPAAASELALLHTSVPIVYFGDATFKIYRAEYKKEFKDVSRFTDWEGNALERMALEKSNLVIFSSDWAAQSAKTDYQVAAEKIEILNIGANIDTIPEKDGIYTKLSNPQLVLLFLAVDWERKGGPIAFETLLALVNQGVDVKLIVCGCTPPVTYRHPSMEVTSFLNKNLPGDFAKLQMYLSSSHFLLLPTRADCTPIVNAEAGAYGMPVITTDVGGVSNAVKNGINGFCLSEIADGQDYADLIWSIFRDKQKYEALTVSSRKRFEEELNWDVFSENLKILLEKHGVYNF